MIRYLVDYEGGSRIWDETLLLTEIRMVDVLVTHSEERDTCCRKRLVKEWSANWTSNEKAYLYETR